MTLPRMQHKPKTAQHGREKLPFLRSIFQGVAQQAERLSQRDVRKIEHAADWHERLSMILEASIRRSPEGTNEEAIKHARLQGALAQEEMLQEIPFLRVDEVSERLDITRQAIHIRRSKCQLFALRRGNRFIYPAWQFDPRDPSGVLEHFPETLKALRRLDPWATLLFLTSPNHRLDDQTPIEALKQGHGIERIKQAIEAYGEHGGS